jgi:hypothetical protein
LQVKQFCKYVNDLNMSRENTKHLEKEKERLQEMFEVLKKNKTKDEAGSISSNLIIAEIQNTLEFLGKNKAENERVIGDADNYVQTYKEPAIKKIEEDIAKLKTDLQSKIADLNSGTSP